MSTVTVRLRGARYRVLIGSGLFGSLSFKRIAAGRERAMIVSDSSVMALYGEVVRNALKKVGLEVMAFVLDPGERSKTMANTLRLIDKLTENKFSRADLLVALGGGVVGDLAGFAASIYKRGMGLLHLPTTLMAQVDSSIGGKTGVDLPAGKNLVGTFYQPLLVVCDVDALGTLPEREFRSGFAEVVKYHLLRPVAFRRSPVEGADELLALEKEALVETVAACVRIKARIVEADEKDAGIRAILNYGHTLGHALEAVTGYSGRYTHGEAVSIGMVFASIVSRNVGLAESGITQTHIDALRKFGLPVKPSETHDFESLFTHMLQDKKARGDLTMVLLKRPGEPVVKRGVEKHLLKTSYEELLRQES